MIQLVALEFGAHKPRACGPKVLCASLVYILLGLLQTPYSKMAANKLFFCLHVNLALFASFSLQNSFVFFIHVDEAKRANYLQTEE